MCAYLYVKQPILNNVETDNAQTDMPKFATLSIRLSFVELKELSSAECASD